MSGRKPYSTVIRRLDPLGRIVLPKKFRDKLNMEIKDDVEMALEGTAISVKKHSISCKFCGKREDLKVYKGMYLCPLCITDIKKLKKDV